MSKAWIGVDLDGTLAVYDSYKGPLEIGEPIAKMVERVRSWIADGKLVKIFTARVGRQEINEDTIEHQIQFAERLGHPMTREQAIKRIMEWNESIPNIKQAISAWCFKHVGKALPVTNEKDFGMIELWDDRAVQVVGNTGERVGDESANAWRKH